MGIKGYALVFAYEWAQSLRGDKLGVASIRPFQFT